jgi:hypothetical protein
MKSSDGSEFTNSEGSILIEFIAEALPPDRKGKPPGRPADGDETDNNSDAAE